MNIVYGGAFNPPQLAHLEIVRKLLSKYQNAKVIVLPVGNTYKKDELIAFNHRFNMLQLMFNNKDRVIVSNIEDKNVFNGTIASLDELSKTYDNLHLVIGSDHVETLNKWIKYEELLKKYPIIIMQRNNDNVSLLMEKYHYLNVKYYNFNFDSEINSTAIRENIIKYKKWLDEDVFNYIKINGLYGVDKDV